MLLIGLKDCIRKEEYLSYPYYPEHWLWIVTAVESCVTIAQDLQVPNERRKVDVENYSGIFIGDIKDVYNCVYVIPSPPIR